MIRRVLAIFSDAPYYVGVNVDNKNSIAFHTTITIKKMGWSTFGSRALLLTMAMHRLEKAGKLKASRVYTIHFYKNGEFGLITEE